MFNVKHLLILSLIYYNGHAWRKVKIVFTNLAFDYGNKDIEGNATLAADGSLTFFAKSLKNVDRLFLTVRIKFSSDGSENFDIDFMNKTVNACQILLNRRYEPLIQLTYKILSEKIRLPRRCPITKNELFYTKNFNFETDQFPPILRETKVFIYVALSTISDEVLSKIFELSFDGEITHLN